MEDDTFKRILQDKQFHLQIKAEQKEIIQNVLERKDSMASMPTGFFIWGYMYPFTFIFGGYIQIFGGAMYPLTLHVGVKRK
jgi:hypothetical protein